MLSTVRSCSSARILPHSALCRFEISEDISSCCDAHPFSDAFSTISLQGFVLKPRSAQKETSANKDHCEPILPETKSVDDNNRHCVVEHWESWEKRLQWEESVGTRSARAGRYLPVDRRRSSHRGARVTAATQLYRASPHTRLQRQIYVHACNILDHGLLDESEK